MSKPFSRTLTLALTGLLVSTFTLASCGEESGQPGVPAGVSQSGERIAVFNPVLRKTADVDADAGKLIPQDAIVLARVRDVGALVNEARAVAESFQPDSGQFVDVSPLLEMAGLQAESVDMSGSPLVALSITEAGQLPQFIVPVKDADAAVGSVTMPNSLSGSYLGLGMAGKPVVSASTPAIGKGLPDADYALRVDLKALLALYRPMIEPYLDPETLTEFDPSIKDDPAAFSMVEMMTKATKQLLDDAQRLDIALSLDDGALSLDCVFELGGDRAQPPSGSGMSIAQMLPMNDASLYMVFESDWADFADAIMPMYDRMAENLPAEQKDAFLKVMRSTKDLYASMKGGGAFALDFTSQGMQGIGIMENADPVTYLKDYMSYIDKYAKAIKPLPAEFKVVDFADAPDVTVDGVEFNGLKMTFDMASILKSSGGVELPPEQTKEMTAAMEGLLGKDGISFYQGAHEKLVLMTFGSGESLAARLVESVKKGETHKSALIEHARSRLHDRPSMFFGMDLRRLARQMHSFIDGVTPMAIPAVPDGDPVIVWMSWAVTERGYGLQAHIDLAGIAALAKAMTPR